MSEEKTTSALLMDRGLPLGNSEDSLLRRALHVKVLNKQSEPIPFSLSVQNLLQSKIIESILNNLISSFVFDLVDISQGLDYISITLFNNSISQGTIFIEISPNGNYSIGLNTGFKLLQENSSKIILEQNGFLILE